MRKTILILSLALVTALASASDAFAQRINIGGRNGVTIGGGGGYRGGYGWNNGYNNGWNNNYGGRYYGNNGYYGGRFYNTPTYYGNYSTPYYYSDPIIVTEPRPSYYYDPTPAPALRNATITVVVPSADADVWFDDAATQQRGTQRTFYSPGLEPGGTYSYTIKARWMENGKTVDQQRRVQVQPGQSTTVSFTRETSSESLLNPKSNP